MLKTALKLLQKLEKNGYEAYIVGGYVRDYILKIKSTDIDITTNATPMEVKKIFKDKCLPNIEYGSVRVIIRNINFDITTYRKEYKYLNNRSPETIVYINKLEEDLKRRDFLMNTLCMDSSGRIIDLMGGIKSIEDKTIDTVGDSYKKFQEDALRILRAIRFATVLNFNLKDNVKDAIIKTKKYLKNISYERKRQELDRIFSSSNAKYGIKLITDLELDKELEIYNLKNIILCNDILGIYTTLELSDKYPFTSNEKQIIKKVKEAVKCDNLDNYTLYKYGLYVNSIAAELKGISKKKVIEQFNNLPISNKSDIDINGKIIMDLLNKDEGLYIKEIYMDLEKQILYGTLNNNKNDLIKYIIEKYK